MRPAEILLAATHGFLVAALGPRRRLLEVGCGRGALARQLGADGFAVTALDRTLTDPSPADGVRFVEGDFLDTAVDLGPGGHDAVIFTTSLHHITPLAGAIERAASLLAPGGLLVADEFDLGSPGVETLRWYYELQELLAAARSYPADRIDGDPDADPLARWRAGHEHTPPLHTGAEMLAAIGADPRLAITVTGRGPYLYRRVCGGLSDDDPGGRIAAHVLATEQRRLAAGTLDAVGLRIVAARQ
jgi:SAM-dependent methyltransferase